MKTFQLLMVFAACSFFSPQQSQAQIIDSFPWFKLEPRWTGDRMDLGKGYNLTFRARQLKSLKPGSNIKIMPRTTNLKLGTKCFQVSSPTGRGCQTTRVYWRDGNRDGKVQPRVELRAVCLEEKKLAVLASKSIRCN